MIKRPFPCPDCARHFKSPSGVAYHRRVTHGVAPSGRVMTFYATQEVQDLLCDVANVSQSICAAVVKTLKRKQVPTKY